MGVAQQTRLGAGESGGKRGDIKVVAAGKKKTKMDEHLLRQHKKQQLQQQQPVLMMQQQHSGSNNKHHHQQQPHHKQYHVPLQGSGMPKQGYRRQFFADSQRALQQQQRQRHRLEWASRRDSSDDVQERKETPADESASDSSSEKSADKGAHDHHQQHQQHQQQDAEAFDKDLHMHLAMLHHAMGCAQTSEQCPEWSCCAWVKDLFEHMLQCRLRQEHAHCRDPNCRSMRRALHHYYTCRFSGCRTCALFISAMRPAKALGPPA